jgi:hypothetical protein
MIDLGVTDITDAPVPLPGTSKESPAKEEEENRGPSQSQSGSKNKLSKGRSGRSAPKKKITRKGRKGSQDVKTPIAPSILPSSVLFSLQLVKACNELTALCDKLISEQRAIRATLLAVANKGSGSARSCFHLAEVYFYISTFSSQLLSAMRNIVGFFSVVCLVQIQSRMLISEINVITSITILLERNFKILYTQYILRSLHDEVTAQPRKANERFEEASQRSEEAGMPIQKSTGAGHSENKPEEAGHSKKKPEEGGRSSSKAEQAGHSTYCKETGREKQLSAISQQLDTVIEQLQVACRKLQHVPEPRGTSSTTCPPHSETDDHEEHMRKEFLKLEMKLTSVGERILFLASIMSVLHRKNQLNS